MSSWQCVYHTEKLYRAEITKSILEEKGIDAVVVNKKDTNYHFGQLEVHVNPDHVIQSIKIIEDEIKFD
ncbi:putative signal transducing protein [Bacteroidota bacterium]